MHIRIAQMIGMTAALLLAVVASSASARSFSASEQGFRAIWTSFEFESSFSTVRCRLTVEGSYHTRQISKTARTLIGAVNRAIFGHACTGGEAWSDNGSEALPLGTAPNRMPWHLTYESFSGTLPAISAIAYLLSRISIALRVTVLGLTCQGRYGTPEDNITVVGAREGGGGITTLTPTAGLNRLSLVEQLGPNLVCPSTLALRGTGSKTNLAGTGRVTITLI